MNLPKLAIDVLLIVVGSICMAFSISAFMIPYKLAAGGPPGVSVLITQVLDVSPGLVILILNGFLMLLGLRALGMSYLIRTLAAVVLISLLTDSLLYWLPNLILTDIRFLNALYAGTFLGIGIGLIFRSGGSSGGWSILSRLVADKFHIGVGQAAVILDSTVVLISAIVFNEYETALMGGITVLVSGKLIDKIIT